MMSSGRLALDNKYRTLIRRLLAESTSKRTEIRRGRVQPGLNLIQIERGGGVKINNLKKKINETCGSNLSTFHAR